MKKGEYERLSIRFRSNVSWFGGVLVFGFFILRSIFLILSPKEDGGGYGKSRIIIELGPMGL